MLLDPGHVSYGKGHTERASKLIFTMLKQRISLVVSEELHLLCVVALSHLVEKLIVESSTFSKPCWWNLLPLMSLSYIGWEEQQQEQTIEWICCHLLQVVWMIQRLEVPRKAYLVLLRDGRMMKLTILMYLLSHTIGGCNLLSLFHLKRSVPGYKNFLIPEKLLSLSGLVSDQWCICCNNL